MANLSNKTKAVYLLLLIVFISFFGLFWMDYIGLIDARGYINPMEKEAPSVMSATDDEPSLVAREEFEKEKARLMERIQDLDKREAMILEREKEIEAESEKISEMQRGLELEKKKFEDEKKEHSGYQKNVKDLAYKIANMPPGDSVKIMVNWEDSLIIDVLRQMDMDAAEAGRSSITAYLITLMPKKKASRIMYLMTQL